MPGLKDYVSHIDKFNFALDLELNKNEACGEFWCIYPPFVQRTGQALMTSLKTMSSCTRVTAQQ